MKVCAARNTAYFANASAFSPGNHGEREINTNWVRGSGFFKLGCLTRACKRPQTNIERQRPHPAAALSHSQESEDSISHTGVRHPAITQLRDVIQLERGACNIKLMKFFCRVLKCELLPPAVKLWLRRPFYEQSRL